MINKMKTKLQQFQKEIIIKLINYIINRLILEKIKVCCINYNLIIINKLLSNQKVCDILKKTYIIILLINLYIYISILL